MNFKGTLANATVTDPVVWPSTVKAHPPLDPFIMRAGKPVKVRMADLPPKSRPIFVKPCVTLTTAEREWLGATVCRSDGAVGQVWALAPERDYVWVVADGEFWFQVHTDALELVQSRVDQLALDV